MSSNLRSSNGFGLCGHKNTFNSSVRQGNWVEDNIGGELAIAPRSGRLSYETEVRKNYVHPANMTSHRNDTHAKDKINIQEIKARNKDGLSYGLVFNHNSVSDERFQTTNQTTFKTSDFDKYRIPDRSKNEEREKEIRREAKLLHHKLSQTHTAALRLGTISFNDTESDF
mmetsp:Transcript_12030/g.12093  ORF Transcript_12030/g.12093 Transcript_12030/m.12093 type:complete len:170 (-) Transcript_12030:244-753(-)